MKKIKMFLKVAVVIGIVLGFLTPGAVTVVNYGKTAKVQASVNTIVASTIRDIICVDANTIFTIENPPVDFEVVDADPFDGFGDNGPYSTFNDALLGTLGECRSMAEFDISSFSVPPGEFISVATFEVIITEIHVFGLGVNGETPESLAVDGYVGNGLEELSDFEAGDGNVLDSIDTPNPQIGQVLSFNVTSFVTDLVDAQEQYVGLTIRAETFGGLWVTEGGIFPKLTIETITESNNPPNPPSNPNPPDGATDVDADADLSWTCSDPDGDDLTYDVYFGTSSSPPLVSSGQTDTTYDPGTLQYNQMYYWQIEAFDNHGASTIGPVWSFTTGSEPNNPPYEPGDPSPEDGATNVYVNTDLSWTGGDPDEEDTVVYDVYLEVDNPDPTLKVSDDQIETTFDPGTLEYDTIYYWKVHAKDNHGRITRGPVWHFTTMEEQNEPPTAPAINGPNSGDPGSPYSFDFTSSDPDGDVVSYYIDWDDGTTSGWTALQAEGTPYSIDHEWSSGDTYTITAKAKDESGLVGPSSTHQITIKKTRAINIPLLNWLQNRLNMFPLLQTLLQRLGLQ